MIKRLIRIYTPFICALTAIIHGVLFLLGHKGIIYKLMGEFTGHSILLILYIICTSSKMCKWYKITNLLLLSIHIMNITYVLGFLTKDILLYSGIIINLVAVMTFLIYRVTAGVTKILC